MGGSYHLFAHWVKAAAKTCKLFSREVGGGQGAGGAFRALGRPS